MLSDHLGSTSLTTDSAGNVISELRYTAWGEVRYQAGTTSTSYTYTGQYSNTADFGLMFYNARWYDSQLGRFTQADSIVPGEKISQSWDRFAYVGNNPVKNTDPDGRCYPLCTMAIGAAVGAIAGAAIYTYNNHGTNFDYTEFAVAVGAGIITGGLVGTGVGIGMAAATGTVATTAAGIVLADASMAIGAGTSGALTAASYTTSHPGEFDALDFTAQTVTSTIAGGTSSNPSAGVAARIATNVIAGEVSYLTNGTNTHTATGVLITGVGSAVLSAPNIPIIDNSGKFLFPKQTFTNLSIGVVNGGLSSFVTGFGANFGGKFDEDYFE